jgi:ligand-binding SRPBCC domain-containing protein
MRSFWPFGGPPCAVYGLRDRTQVVVIGLRARFGRTQCMKLVREQRLPGTPEQVFPFFADAANLEAITPPWLHFRIVTPQPIEMREGALIEYRLRLRGIPIRWRTRIDVWEPGVRFVDRQLSGPYRLWHHTHEFEPDGPDHTLMRDTVRFEVPFARLAMPLVSRDLKRIFDFRAQAIAAARRP